MTSKITTTIQQRADGHSVVQFRREGRVVLTIPFEEFLELSAVTYAHDLLNEPTERDPNRVFSVSMAD